MGEGGSGKEGVNFLCFSSGQEGNQVAHWGSTSFSPMRPRSYAYMQSFLFVTVRGLPRFVMVLWLAMSGAIGWSASPAGDASVAGDTPPASAVPAREAQKGLLPEEARTSRIAVVGSAVARSFLEDGHFQALLEAAHAESPLTVSNLAFAGDTVPVGPEEIALRQKELREVRAEVVLAFYGSVEASAGKAGVEEFRKKVASFLKSFSGQTVSGIAPSRLVLVGPPSLERALEAPAAEPSPTERNRQLYSQVMAEEAAQAGVAFFDLYTATQQLFKTGPQRAALLPKRWGSPQSALTVHGGFLTSEGNRLLARVLFEALFGKQAPEIVAKRSILTQSPADGSPKPPQDTGAQIPALEVAEGFDVSLFADEARFPDLQQPVQIDWDSQGRLWVLCRLDDRASGRLLIFEDTDADGKADLCTVYADKLKQAGGFCLYRDGVLLQAEGELWLLRDPLGSGRVSEKQRLLSGMGVSDQAAGRAVIQLDPKGGVLLFDSGARKGRVETGLGPTAATGGLYRFEPTSGGLEVLSPRVSAEWTGSVLDSWGRDVCSATRGEWTLPWKSAPRSLVGAILVGTGPQVPASWQGRLLAASAGSPAGIISATLKKEGAGFKAEPSLNLLMSPSGGLQPAALSSGPDANIWVGEGRGEKGRLYRVAASGSPRFETPPLKGAELPDLLERLKLPEQAERRRSRNEIASRPVGEVLTALKRWEQGLDKKDVDYERLRLEALWLSRWMHTSGGTLNLGLLKDVLKSPSPEARAEAVRIAREARDLLPDALELLKGMAGDSDPAVRFEVLVAAAGYPEYSEGAVRLVHQVLAMPLDSFLEAAAKEALDRLEPDSKRLLVPKDGQALKFVLSRLSPERLANAPGCEPVWMAQVDRLAMTESAREEALKSLASARHSSRTLEIVAAVKRSQSAEGGALPLQEKLLRLLLSCPDGDLRSAFASMEELAAGTKVSGLRKMAQAAWLRSAPDAGNLWQRLHDKPEMQMELLKSLPLVKAGVATEAMHRVLVEVLREEKPSSVLLLEAAVQALPDVGQRYPGEDFELLAGQISKGRAVFQATQALARLPEGTAGGAPLALVASVVEALTRWLEEQPADARKNPEFVKVLNVSRSLAEGLASRAAEAARRLRDVK